MNRNRLILVSDFLFDCFVVARSSNLNVIYMIVDLGK